MTINRESKAYRRMARLLEVLFLALAGLYILYRISKSTTFHLIWPSWFEPGLMHGLTLIALLRLLTGKLWRRETLVALAFALIYGMIYRTDGYSFLPFLSILTVGFIDIGHRKILRMFLLTAGTLYCVTVLAGYLGVITNYVRIKNGLRSAWGISYPTDFASLGFYLLLALWVAADRLPDWAMLLICAVFGAVAWFIAHSSTSTICLALLFCAILYHIYERGIDRRHPNMRWMKRGVNLFSTLSFPLLALCMLGMMAMYARGMNLGFKLNSLLSNRLKYQVTAWQTYGVKPFGTPFVLHGDGFSVFPQPNYTFVDSSYPLIILRYGWVLFIALCLSWGWTARKAIRCGDRRLVLVLGIIAVHSFSEHHFIDVHFNILLAMPLAAYLSQREPVQNQLSESRAKGDGKATVVAWVGTVLLLILGACLFGPRLMAWLKTALEIMGYGHGTHALRLIYVLLGVMFGGCAVLWSVSHAIKALLAGKPRGARAPVAVLLGCAIVAGGLGMFANGIINRAAGENEAMVEADRQAMEIAVKSATGKVFSGVLPELYARKIDGLSYAPFFEDDMARLPGNTVLLPSDTERGTFIHNGFLYVPVSQTHALYTGDRAVVEALTAAGYQATGYYSGVQRVDLEEASALNALEYDPQRGVRLDGSAGAMQNGPWRDLYGGRYTMTWTLGLPEGASRGKETVCTLRLTINKGDNVILEKEVSGDQFDEQGQLSVSIPFKIASSRSVAFEAVAAPGCRVDVSEIRFVRTPVYDVHSFYNSKLKKVRDEYYGRDGQPVLRKEGWFACDYEYDGQGNVTCLSYYDCDGQPVIVSGGYARKRQVYNVRRQVVRVEYYGPDDKPITVASGYAFVEMEYDAAGNIALLRYFNTDGLPCVISSGYAQVRRAYNDKKQVVRELYYGADGRPIRLSEGCYGVEMAYDRAGNVSMRRYLDESGHPVVLANKGYAEVRRKYDGLHQIIKESYYDAEGAPTLCSRGFAANEREYDEAGNAVVQRFLDLEDNPVMISAGYAEVHREYNRVKQITSERYYGVGGKPVALPTGQFGVEIGYDGVGNPYMRRYLDARGNVMLIDKGYAEYRREYNSRKKVVKESYYGVDGELIECVNGYAWLEREYDRDGNITAVRYFDSEGNPVNTVNGYAEVQREYDGKRQLIRETYYDAQGQMTNPATGKAGK